MRWWDENTYVFYGQWTKSLGFAVSPSNYDFSFHWALCSIFFPQLFSSFCLLFLFCIQDENEWIICGFENVLAGASITNSGGESVPLGIMARTQNQSLSMWFILIYGLFFLCHLILERPHTFSVFHPAVLLLHVVCVCMLGCNLVLVVHRQGFNLWV